MRAVDFIVRHIEEHNMTQTEAAALTGWSRQNFWDKLNNRNPRYRTMLHILTSFGYELHLERLDGKPLDVDEAEFFDTASRRDVLYDDMVDLAGALGYQVTIS